LPCKIFYLILGKTREQKLLLRVWVQ